jgi:APA family basic amino acid/polyamine antiporter
MSLARTKSVEQSIQDTDEPEHRLRKNLSAWDLTVFGIGVIIGTGIFVLTGIQAAVNAGPGLVLSFVIAAVACALAAMCYAEFASTVPVAGSAYTFSYATLGELVAWIIGWDLLLELALGAAVVSRGWSAYLQSLLGLPPWLAGDKAVPDWGAIFIVAVLGLLIIFGTKLSSRVTGVLVVVKLAVVGFVIVAGAFFINPSNYKPFIPPPVREPTAGNLETPLFQVMTGQSVHFGFLGILAAASIVFFAYIGFDIVATAAEETKVPQRDVPRGILGSLIICTVLYMAVTFVITGMKKYTELNTGAPLADAFTQHGTVGLVASKLISLGGILGITTVIMVLLLGQSRVLFAMTRDGLLPRPLAKVHKRFRTPYVITLITMVVVMALAGFVPLTELSEMTSIGTLAAFVLVSIGVIVLRRKRPDLHRGFTVPGVPWLPIVSILACAWLMLNLSAITWIRFLIWMAVGFVLYFAYGYRNSRLAKAGRGESLDTPPEPLSGRPM